MLAPLLTPVLRPAVAALCLLLASVSVGSARAQVPAPRHAPTFPELLAASDVSLDDLSRLTPPDWLGRTEAASVPFVLPHLGHVQDDPRHLLRLGSNALTVAQQAAGRPEGPDLVKLFTVYALQPRRAGFRGVVPPEPAVPTLAEVLRAAGAEADVAGVEDLPPALRGPLARLVAAAARAAERVERSWKGAPPQLLDEALALRDVPRLLPGASVSWPSLTRLVSGGLHGHLSGDTERAAAAMDLLRTVEAVAEELTAADPASSSWTETHGRGPWSATTRWGRVLVTGPGDDAADCSDCFVLLDLGGDDDWTRDLTSLAMPVSVALDLAGDDEYAGPWASGRGGVAVVYDAAGRDRYAAGDDGLGFGFLGYGVLFDAAGDDVYAGQSGSQGAGLFGAGVLIDGGGDDSYSVHGEGQGFGGPGGCGALVDLGGDDTYRAEPDPATAPGRADYHSEGRVNASNAQGAGVGRRGDLTDGHLWAGGAGFLVDVSGGDRYVAGNFAQASGYAYGTGFLLDGAGHDVYSSIYFSQGSASHEAAALLLDVSGDDRHELATGAGLGYGWDFAVGVLADLGGNDVYRSRKLALGSADASSLGLFLEVAGTDHYEVASGAGAQALGAAPETHPAGGPPHLAAEQVRGLGLFFDLGGADAYPELRACRPADGAIWRCLGGRGADRQLALTPSSFWKWLFA